nr:f-box protein cpr30 [Quercus suber]
MFECLPFEVLLEIFHRLPLKSLIQFRYLDVKTHVERYKLIHEDSDNNDSLSEQIQDLEFPLRSRCDYFQLVGSVNGLFCLYEENRFILWNPYIRKYITLPNPSVTGLFPCYLALGFDSRNNDYKVVRIAYQLVKIRSLGAKPPLVEVYSVREGSWRITSGGDSYPPKITISNWPHQAASLNGAVYFPANDWGEAQSSVVLSFDLGDEVFRVISLPNGKFKLDARIGTSVFKGLLSLICYEHRHMGEYYMCSVKSCSVWVMKEYGVVDSWTKQFTIDLDMQYWKVLGFWKNDHMLVQKMQLHGSMLFSYDPESQQVNNLGFYRSTCYSYSYADNYVENLVLLDKPNDVISKKKVSNKRKCR